MIISELLKDLTKLLHQHGDVPVCVYDGYEDEVIVKVEIKTGFWADSSWADKTHWVEKPPHILLSPDRFVKDE
jgi:hypothetical protein